MKKQISSALLAALLLTMFSACGSGGADGADNQTSAPAVSDSVAGETVPAETGRSDAKDSLPADLDFKGESVDIILRAAEARIVELFVEESDGDIVNDAVFERSRRTEEKLNVALKFHPLDDSTGNKIGETLKTSVLAGDTAYDIGAAGAYYTTPKALEGVFLDMNVLPYIDFDAVWWDQNFIEAATVYDKLFFLTGELSISATDQSYVTFFNKKLVGEYLPDADLYKLVTDGKWTISKYDELVKGIYKDLNGNGARDKDDFYGYAMALGTRPLDAFTPACQIKLIEKNKNGDPELVVNNERTVQMFDMVFKLIYNNEGVWQMEGTADNLNAMWEKFKASQSVFYIHLLSGASDLRDFEDPYGILPIPKFNDAQENYYTIPHDQYTIFVVPSNCKSKDAVGATLEFMCAESYRTVTDKVFETALKVKYLRDDIDAQMFELIVAGKGFDLGVIFSNSLGNLSWVGRNVLKSSSNSFASYYASIETATKTSLENVIKQLKALG